MLNQYYKFLDKELYSFMTKTNLLPGNRYFLILNNIEEIGKLETAIKYSDDKRIEEFKSEEYNFTTIYYKIKDLKIIFVFAKNGVTHDFLVTIRNKVSLQKNEWENSVVIFMIQEDLDSITGGAYNLAKQGAPFHTLSLRNDLKNIINSKDIALNKSEKTIMKFVVENNFEDDLVRYTLMDFESVYSIIEQGEIKADDYLKLGIFRDNQIDTYPEKDAKKRLEYNKELFDTVSSYHDKGNPRDNIENNFDGKSMVNSLTKDNWYEIDFESIKQSKEGMDQLKKIEMDFLEEDFSDQFKDFEVWDKASGNTKVKSRERNIIVFKNRDKLDDIILPFTEKIEINSNYVINRGLKTFDLTVESKVDLTIKSRNNKLIMKTSLLKPEHNYYFEFTYKHNGENALTFKFRILLVNFSSDYLSSIKTKYKLKYDPETTKVEFLIDDIENDLILNDSEMKMALVEEVGENYNYLDVNSFNFSNLNNDLEDDIYILIDIQGVVYKFKPNQVSNKPFPESSINLVKYINENKSSMIFSNNVVTQGTKEFYLYNEMKSALEVEERILKERYLSGRVTGEEFIGTPVNVNQNIINKYEKLCDIILGKNTLPSIMYYDDEIVEAAEEYCYSVEEVLNSLPDDEKIQDEEVKLIHDIGVVRAPDQIYLTPLHPLLLRYEIEKTRALGSDETSTKILKKYNASNLMPFIVDEKNNYYFSEYNENLSRWLEYKPFNQTSKLNSNTTSFIIKSRIRDFKQHFKYLFNINSSFSLKARFLNISNYKMILQGVADYLLTDFNNQKNMEYANPIDVFIDNLGHKDLFYEFYNIRNLSELTELLDIRIPSQLKRYYEEEDIIETLKEKVNIFTEAKDSLFHITFFNFNQEPQFSFHNIEDLNCSVAEQGLLSSISYTKMGSEYVSGFGLNGLEDKNNLIKNAILWNSFAANQHNKQLNPYRKNVGIVNNVTNLTQMNLDDIFNKTNWVTFIDPSVDLSYFNDSNYSLYVIHYNDQTSSFNYESITVTNNTLQYQNVLKEFLSKVHREYHSLKTENIIRSFNILNGEWLLSIIGNKSSSNLKYNHTMKEKLSIISAYKNVLSMLENDKIAWIPISLEEILRVSRQQGLESSSDIFSTKELGHKGSISDDLLFMGLEMDNFEKITVHFMPVEVKIGQNKGHEIKKATEQINHIYALIEKELIKDNKNRFSQNFYRTFFINLYFGNLKKFIDNNILTDSKLLEMYENRSRILNGNIEFTNILNKNYSTGLIVLFNKDSSFRKILKQQDSNIYEIHLIENDAYFDADKEYSKLNEEMKQGKKGIDIETFLSSNISKIDDYILEDSQEQLEQDLVPENGDEISMNGLEKEQRSNIGDEIISEKELIFHKETTESLETNKKEKSDIENVRLLLGKIKGSNEKLYWEYGHYGLPNRHLLISGKSGQGKTYFMQCLLLEMSKNNIDSLIVDYTDGFLNNQLEESFIEKLGEKLKTKFVFRDKLPINPFKRNDIDLGGVLIPETNDDIADRVVQIIDFVFSLGIQQNSLLKEVVKKGLSIYDENLTFSKIKEYLLDDETATSANLYGRISNLLDRDPFDYKDNEFDWGKIFNFQGEVNIIQLKGFAPDIQKVITEFLLWDLYNYSQREGSKNHPIPILLDEMQNLNHQESSPTGKILKEGRKFGWSSWLATQSLTSIKNAGGEISSFFNAGQQIHFAAPEDQILFISKTLSADATERKQWESKISALNKGECIVNGYAKVNDKLNKITEVIEVSPLEER